MSKRINNVLCWLEDSALRHPDKIAFADETTSATYAQVIERAKGLALRITRLTPPRTPVAVLGVKSVTAVTAFFACVYAGCFYVPLNPAHPNERRQRILATLNEPLVLVLPDAEDLLADYPENKVLKVGECGVSLGDYSVLEDIRAAHIDIDPLYIMFTSGTTGEPKGIVVSHRSVIDFIEEFTHIFDIREDEVIGNQAPFDFDVSVKDIYSSVRVGATVQIIPKQKFSFPVMLIDYLCERKVTTLIWAVSALCILSGFRAFTYKVPEFIRKILFSGEAMPIKQLKEWKKYFPDAEFVNLYGPTEITCNCAYYRLKKGEFDLDVLPIGKPFPNERIYLLSESGEQVTAPGAEGEICVSGTALSLGYYNNPSETERAFVRNPLITAYEDKLYKTGDLGYYDEDGNLCFVGRKDLQIKHLGHRIELSEIESAMAGIDKVARAVCLYDDVKKKIWAFYTGDAEAADIASALREKLPSYMTPNTFKRIDKFPLTENGKVDRKALLKEYVR